MIIRSIPLSWQGRNFHPRDPKSLPLFAQLFNGQTSCLPQIIEVTSCHWIKKCHPVSQRCLANLSSISLDSQFCMYSTMDILKEYHFYCSVTLFCFIESSSPYSYLCTCEKLLEGYSWLRTHNSFVVVDELYICCTVAFEYFLLVNCHQIQVLKGFWLCCVQVMLVWSEEIPHSHVFSENGFFLFICFVVCYLHWNIMKIVIRQAS